jgi:hypothetical protein
VSPIGGLGFAGIAKIVLGRHEEWMARSPSPTLPDRGLMTAG